MILICDQHSPVRSGKFFGREKKSSTQEKSGPGIDAMAAVCKDRLERFQSVGQAANIVAVPRSEMAKRYEPGRVKLRLGQ